MTSASVTPMVIGTSMLNENWRSAFIALSKNGRPA